MKRIGVFVGSDIFSWIICHNLITSTIKDYNYEVFFPAMRQRRVLPVDLNMLATYERKIAWDAIYPFVELNLSQCNGPYLPPGPLLSSNDVPYKHVEDINDTEFLREVERFDGIISIRCYQKFSSAYMDRFCQDERILWNLHPGDLPSYRGVMTLYRAMMNRDSYVALTLHEMTAAWDDGPIISKCSMPLNMELSFLENMIFLALLGSGLINASLMRMNAPGRHLTLSQTDAKYWSFPSEQEIHYAKTAGVRLVDHDRVRELYSNLFIGDASQQTARNFTHQFDSYIESVRS
jgi:hypothetical protein